MCNIPSTKNNSSDTLQTYVRLLQCYQRCVRGLFIGMQLKYSDHNRPLCTLYTQSAPFSACRPNGASS